MIGHIYCHFLQFCSITKTPLRCMNALFSDVKILVCVMHGKEKEQDTLMYFSYQQAVL